MKLFHLVIGGVVAATGITLAIVLPITLSKNSSSSFVPPPEDNLGEDLQAELNAVYNAFYEDSKDGKVGTNGQELTYIEKYRCYLSKDGELDSISEDKEIYQYNDNSGYWDKVFKNYGRELSPVANPNPLYNEYYIYYF